MKCKLAGFILLLTMVACGESRNRVGSNHLDGAPGSGGAQGSTSGGGMIATSVGGSTGAASSTNPAGGTNAGGNTSAGGSLGKSSASGGTGPGGAGGFSGTATGGRGGFASATPPNGSSPLPDAGASTGGQPTLDGGTPGLDGSAPSDAPLGSNPDGAGVNTDARRADAPEDGGPAFCYTSTTGCMCSTVPTTQPIAPVCNNQTQDPIRMGRCCAASNYCVCDVFVCATESSSGRCQCDFEPFIPRLPTTWSTTTQCPTPAAGFKCCLHSKEGFCQCKQQECTDGSIEVANCALSQLNTCATGEVLVDSCK